MLNACPELAETMAILLSFKVVNERQSEVLGVCVLFESDRF